MRSASRRLDLGDILDEWYELRKRADVVDLAEPDANRLDYLRGILNQVHLREHLTSPQRDRPYVMTDQRMANEEREQKKKVERGEAKPWAVPI